MAGIDLDKIIEDLERRFAAPLREFYKRRIIFWYDEDREFEDMIGDIKLSDAKILVLTGTNIFEAKKLLAKEDTGSNYLVYCPFHYDKLEDDWLLNIELYSEEFHADLNSMRMDEMGLANNASIRLVVKNYHKFFDNARRRKSVAAFAREISTAAQLHMAIMASICSVRNPKPGTIIRAVLTNSLEMGNNIFYAKLGEYGAREPFWRMVAQATGYSEGDDADLKRLAGHILLTACTRTIPSEYLKGLDGFIFTPHQSYCYELVSEWLTEDKDSLCSIARFVEDEARLPARFIGMNVEDLIDTECFPCVNECILKELMKEISDDLIDVDHIRRIVEKRRTLAWYDTLSPYYEGILQLANMQEFFLAHTSGFHLAQALDIWRAYTRDYYRMDTFYRKFHLHFNESLTVSSELLDDLFKHVAGKAEGIYKAWFLSGLGSNWSDVCADELSKYGSIPDIKKQEDFYRSKVEASDSKIYVIISDAFRYELAAELAGQLRLETQCQLSLESMQGIFPTITKFGMAALLPHRKLSIIEKAKGAGVSVTADGMSTGMPDRDKVLKAANPKSVALQYKNIIRMKRAERQSLVKGMDIVCIYHDKVDEASHTADSLVFPACEDAISEIKNLVRIICNEFGGTRILITADHGFLYTYSPLTEDDKVDRSSFAGMDVEYGRHYAIVRKGVKPDFLMPVKLADPDCGFDAFAPRENVRIRMNGGGLNYVHGGISLEEMVVPVIDYQFLRGQSRVYQKNRDKYDTRPIELKLLSSTRKVSNMIFSLTFYQTDPVGDNRSACSYSLYFTDTKGKKVSDTVRIIADKTDQNGQNRTFRCGFTLKNMRFNKQDIYYLVIADGSGLRAPKREEFQIDIAFTMDEFNFTG